MTKAQPAPLGATQPGELAAIAFDKQGDFVVAVLEFPGRPNIELARIRPNLILEPEARELFYEIIDVLLKRLLASEGFYVWDEAANAARAGSAEP